MVILLIVTALISDFQEYRNLARLFPELPAGCPYLDVATGYKNLDYILFVTCVFGFVLTISLDFLYYLICSNTRRQGSLWSSWPSQGLRCGLNTHRGPKSPARERNHPGALLFATAVLYSMAFMSTLNPYATPWRPEGSDAATGVSEAQNTPHKPSSSWAKHSGLGPSHDRPDVQPFSKKKSFLRALKRAQLHGMTWYKGKLYSASMLGTSQIETPPRALTPEKPYRSCTIRQQAQSQSTQWFQLEHWSSKQLQAGYSQSMDDPSTPLRSHDPRHQVGVHSNDWAGWAGGVLTLVRRSFCPQERISWREVKQGRMLHVRLYMSFTSIDILNVYLLG